MDNKKRPKKRKNDSLINYIMIALIILLVFTLIVYVAATVLNIGKNNKTDANKKAVIESSDEDKRELNTIAESESEKETEGEKETLKETETKKETESEKETVLETESEKETQPEPDTQEEVAPDTQEETTNTNTGDKVKRGNYSGNVDRRGNRTKQNPYAAIATDEQIRNASDSELVDMIIKGDLGYGQERLDILNLHGIDVEHISRLVNQKLAQ
ncbi:hypothetical protein [Helcococcus kunzii]|uniref:hypothetical protein n=1 Tax=Helcococcus kunzii TaxID=40091 RepID=UPI0038AC8F09